MSEMTMLYVLLTGNMIAIAAVLYVWSRSIQAKAQRAETMLEEAWRVGYDAEARVRDAVTAEAQLKIARAGKQPQSRPNNKQPQPKQQQHKQVVHAKAK